MICLLKMQMMTSIFQNELRRKILIRFKGEKKRASQRIKGITIEIDGDATGLDKALQGIDKQTNSAAKSLKDVNKLLKFDPSNTVLLQQKQQLLSEAISGTKERLSTLKEAEKQAQQAFQEGKISQEQYQALQREIAETEQKLKSLESQAGSASSKLAEMSQKAKDIGEKATNAGKAMMPVTAGLTAVGAAGVKAFKEVDAGLDIVIKKSGATGKAAEELEEVFNNVYGTFPTDSATVGEAVGEINTRLGLTGKELEEASIKFLKFADVNNTDVNTAVQKVSRAMGDAGIASEDYGELLDQLTAAAQASGIEVNALAENLTKYGAPMRQLGFDTQSAIAIFSQWEKAGVNTEIAFSGMKKAISNWTKEGKNGEEEFAKFIKGVQEGSITAQEALDVFGTKAGPDLVDAIQAGRFSYEEFMSIVEGSKGIVESTFAETQDPINDFTTLMNSARLAMAQIGETLLTILAPVIQQVAEKIREFAEWFRNLSPEMQKMIVMIGMLVAAIGPVLIIIGKIATGISGILGLASKLSSFGGLITGVLGGIKTAVSGLFALIMAHPVIAIITAIVAAVTMLYTKCEWFRDGVNAIISSVVGFFSNFGENVKGIFSAVASAIAGAVNSIISFFGNVISSVQNLYSNIQAKWSAIKSCVVNAANNIRTSATTAFSNMLNGIRSTVGNIASAVQNGFNSAISFITSLPSRALGWGRDFVQGLVNGILGSVGNVVNAVKSIASKITSFLHFSRPDEGPLRDYEKWMPDFMSGIAGGIEKNIYRVKEAMVKLSGMMAGSPDQMNVIAGAGGQNIFVEAPPVVVKVGNKEFKSYIVQTANEGNNSSWKSGKKARGA